ncbi:MAG: alginate lyase family protein [Luteolibacter sp.]
MKLLSPPSSRLLVESYSANEIPASRESKIQTGVNSKLSSVTRLLLALLFFMASFAQAQNHSFVHPGIPWTTNDLDQMKKNRSVSPWSDGWEAILNSEEASLEYSMKGPAVNVDRRDNNIAHDGDAALYHALQFYFTGNEVHATKAVGILEAWAATHRTWSGNSVHLHAAWRGGTLVKAAEILRYTYPGWTAQNTRNCEAYFEDVLWPQFRLPNPLRAANQGANNLWGAIQVAIFNNDQVKFQQCIDAFLNDPGGGISNTLPNGQCGDTGRDQGHAFAMVGNLVSVAEIAWAQGVDLYRVRDNRLFSMSEYWCRYNSGESVPYIDFGTTYGYYTSIGSENRVSDAPYVASMLETIVAAYFVRKDTPARHSLAYLKGLPPSPATFLYRKNPGDNSKAPILVEPDPEFNMRNVSNLTSVDVGAVGTAGSSRFQDRNWTVSGAGSDLSEGSDDSFHYVYTKLKGDGRLIAKVDSIENTDSGAKAMVVIRESLSPDSKMAAVTARAELGTEFHSRGFNAADGSGKQEFSLSVVPTWIMIERRGESITGYVGPDGVHWTPMQHTLFTLPKDCVIGLGVTSGNTEELCTATFSNVQFSDGFVKTDESF